MFSFTGTIIIRHCNTNSISPIIPKRCKSHHQLPGKFRSNFEAFWFKLFDLHSDVRAVKNVTL